jgi:hypothetical protein
MQANRLLYGCKVIFKKLCLGITLTHNGHPDALSGGSGIAKLPNLLGPLSLPAPWGATRQPLALAWTLRMHPTPEDKGPGASTPGLVTTMGSPGPSVPEVSSLCG